MDGAWRHQSSRSADPAEGSDVAHSGSRRPGDKVGRGEVQEGDLFDANVDLARACRDHPFVQGIATGRLDRAAFCFYVGQDARFLEAFVRAYAVGVAKAPDLGVMTAFKSLLDGGFDELCLHRSYAARWGVDLAPEAAPATSAYTDFLLRVAAFEPVGHLCAAMTPCMRLYAWLGAELEPAAAVGSPYREWVDTYADPGFESLATALEALLDRLGGDPAVMTAHYRTAMRLELAFFAAAHQQSP
jgi:thiaminase (transcriptional activator TenA)